MRLLNVDTLTFMDFHSSKPPSYAIASHRWFAGTEATWEDVQEKKETSSAGYRKVKGFTEYVKAEIPLVKWLWIDTCCIKQHSDRELSESINSMFRWYRDAEVCLAYLEDVKAVDDTASFVESTWFQRGWTLQELLAPTVVVFLSRDWQIIGYKGQQSRGRSGISIRTGPSLEEHIAAITKIPKSILRDYQESCRITVEEKLSWMNNRETTRGEDLSYSLLGILDVSMNIRYGDGKERTRERLLRKVQRRLKSTTNVISDKYCIPFSLKGMPTANHFVPRAADMKHLTSYFQAAAWSRRRSIFVVYGMGGMGKTQLCVEFARTNEAQFSAVFWIDGSSRDTLRRSMADAALRLPIAQTDQLHETLEARSDTSQSIKNFLQWLSLSDNRSWLLIIDNVDREWRTNSEDPQAYNYHEFLPQADHGSILVTTRLARLQRPEASLRLGSVDINLATELLESRAGKKVEDVKILLPKLGGLPLALVQAGSYLGMTGVTVTEYIRSYDETWADLLRYQDQFSSEEYAERSILTTWKMSYEQVKTAHALAARLLDLWAFLHPEIWPELVLAGQGNPAQRYIPEYDVFPQPDKLCLQRAIGVLVQYSMVNPATADGSHQIHPVVHAWCLHNIDAPTLREQLPVVALRFVATMVDTVSENATRGPALRLAAHANALGRRADMLPENGKTLSDCNKIGVFLSEWENSKEVERLYLKALEDLEKAQGVDHTSTLNIIGDLGNLYAEQDRVEEAYQMYMRALRGFRETWGAEHKWTVATINNLEALFAQQGKNEEAEQMFFLALRGYKNAYGTEHRSTADTVNNLGTLYAQQGKNEEAERMFFHALRGYEEAPGGPEHNETFKIFYRLGNLYRTQGKIEKAEEMFCRAILGYKKVYGLNQQSKLDSVHNLDILYSRQSKEVEAEQILVFSCKALRSLRDKVSS